ncbi:MAG: hypothetical protein AAB071_02825 [Bacteroidota bacterium]
MKQYYINIAFAVLLLCTTLCAQDGQFSIGAGVGVNPVTSVTYLFYGRDKQSSTSAVFPYEYYSFPRINIYLPITYNEHFRIEPEFGMLKSRRSETNSSSYYYSSNVRTLTMIRYGSGFFYRWLVDSAVAMYGGTRAGFFSYHYKYVEQDITDNYDRRENDYYISPSLGGEYLFSKYFALGGEMQFNYVRYGDLINEGQSTENTDTITEDELTTSGLIFIRWYWK